MIRKVESKTETEVSHAIIDMLKPYQAKVLTLTSDNGKEFAGHEKISKALNADFYFAHPYRSWERGTNENTNGLIRQFIPKKKSLLTVNDSQLRVIEELLNQRPRKCLGFKTPNEVFFGSGVALRM